VFCYQGNVSETSSVDESLGLTIKFHVTFSPATSFLSQRRVILHHKHGKSREFHFNLQIHLFQIQKEWHEETCHGVLGLSKLCLNMQEIKLTYFVTRCPVPVLTIVLECFLFNDCGLLTLYSVDCRRIKRNIGEVILTAENRSTRRETILSAIFPTTNPTYTGVGSKLAPAVRDRD
jgi:hypothetical protein